MREDLRRQPTSCRNWIITRQMFVTILDEHDQVHNRCMHVDVDSFFNSCTIMVVIISMQELKLKIHNY